MFAIKGVPAGSDPPGDVPRYSRVTLGCSRPGACFSKVPIAVRPQKAVSCLHSRLRQVVNINFENYIRLSVNEAKLTGF